MIYNYFGTETFNRFLSWALFLVASRITGIARRSLLWKGRRKMRHNDSVNFHVVGPFANAQAGREEIGCDTEYIIQYCLWWFHHVSPRKLSVVDVVASFQSQNSLKAAISCCSVISVISFKSALPISSQPSMPLRPSKVTAWPYDYVGISNETRPLYVRAKTSGMPAMLRIP